MLNKRCQPFTILLISFFSLFLLASPAFSIEVVVNRETSAPDSLSREQILHIFMLRERLWEDGTQITVFLLPRHSLITKDFAATILGVPVDTYFRLIDHLNDTKQRRPEVMTDEYALMIKLSNTPGGIGYIFKSDIVKDAHAIKRIIIVP